MKNDYLLFQMHVMWYEYKIVREGLDSLQKTMENSNIDAQGFTFENFVDEDLT